MMITKNQSLNKKVLSINIVFSLLAWISVIFHIYLVMAGLMPNLVSRPMHFLLALPWIFFYHRNGYYGLSLKNIISYLIGIVGVLCSAYIIINQNDLSDQYGTLYETKQFVIAICLILIVLEMARRAIKWPLPCVAIIAICYGLLGPYLPGSLGFSPIPVASFLGTLVIAEGGIWGDLTNISATIVAIFVILGAVVSAGDAGNGFMALATKLAGSYRGGAAKVSVIASALFGSISGSASANVASTGSVTLPMMKKLGYPSYFAAATAAVASTGGQIMPPLMGAGAFIMVELLGLPYSKIMQSATLPALLFFYAVWVGVDAFAKLYNLKGLEKNQLPNSKTLLTTLPFFLLPFGLLLYLLFAKGYTAQHAACYSIFLAAVMLVTNSKLEFSIKSFFLKLNKAAIDSAKQISAIASIIICASLIIGVLNQTGLGIKITSMIIAFSGGNLWIALLLTAIACLLLGMEVPTTAAYLICISVAGPALQKMGLPLLHAHLFVFWYALLSTITPPVCGTVFIASGMAEAPWLKTATISMRLGVGLYIIPLAMVAQPALVSPIETPFSAILATIRIGFALWLISKITISNKINWLSLMFLLSAILLLFWH